MDKTIKLCDVCGEIILNPDCGSNRMIEGFDNYQKWPVGTKSVDVCKNCCLKISQMDKLDIIKIDLAPLFIQAGFVKDGELWRYAEELEMKRTATVL